MALGAVQPAVELDQGQGAAPAVLAQGEVDDVDAVVAGVGADAADHAGHSTAMASGLQLNKPRARFCTVRIRWKKPKGVRADEKACPFAPGAVQPDPARILLPRGPAAGAPDKLN